MVDLDDPGRRTVYLAGAIERSDDPDSWRNELEEEFKHVRFINPMDSGIDPHEEPYRLVWWCFRQVQFSDYVIVNYEKGVETWGTPMELLWAWLQGVPVLLWTIEDPEDMPAFLKVMTDVGHEDVGELIKAGSDFKVC